jgi:hypothetical protein
MPTQRPRKRWNATPTATIRSARGEHLGSPLPHQRPTTRESRHLAQLAGRPTSTGRAQIFTRGRRRMEATRRSNRPPPTPHCMPMNLCCT